MSLGRYAKKRDTSEKPIVDALRKVGAQVLFADDIDLIVLFRGTIFLIEVKTPKMDDATRRAAYDLYGGWRALCSRLPAEGPELLGTAKLLKGGYRAYHHCDQRLELPAGETGRELTATDARKALSSLKLVLKDKGLPHGTL